MSGSILIIPFGSVSKNLCRDLGDAVTEIVGLPAELGIPLGEPKYAFNPGRDQYHTAAILRRVAQAIGTKHTLGLGVVNGDLFTPDLNFVFGDADRAERAGVISITRMDQTWYGRDADHPLLMRRALSEALATVGHILGLPHCSTDSCAMFLSNTLSDTDRKRGRYCDGCANKVASAVAALAKAS